MKHRQQMNVDEALLIADEAHTGFSGHLLALQILVAEVRRQHGEIEILRPDAARYRYLRNRVPSEVLDGFGREAGIWIDMETDEGRLQLLTGDDADKDIDEAIAKERSK
jgi:hypothetical protein